MRRPLLHCLVALLLLVQGLGSVWAASGMAGQQATYSASVAELPPCHMAGAKAKGVKAGCCVNGHCQCADLCAASAAAPLSLSPSLPVLAVARAEASSPSAALLLGHHQRPPRPPAA